MSPKSFESQVQPWNIIEENKEYSAPVFDLLKRRIRLKTPEDFAESDYFIIKAPEWISVIPITPNNKVVLVEQFRHGIQQPTLEIPGGIVDEGEAPLEAARRELREEAGYTSEKWKSLGEVSANPSMMTNYTHMFVAEDCAFAGVQNQDENERIAVHTVPMDKFLRMTKDGAIHHAIVLAAVARYLLRNDE